ncbi:hypothetical protein HK102_009923 [Quaeritorhiza haematococci]|nr:hypothetical protein HK102_009923 [Quaeritorhiza haematococci]
MVEERPHRYLPVLLAGGIAGTSVDTILYPLDTIKTRLQSKAGFRGSGGFSGVYSGLSSAIAGSAPSAAAFFVTYELSKRQFRNILGEDNAVPTHMLAASLGEISALIVRVPTEVIKQRLQAKQYSNIRSAVSSVYRNEGFLGFYRGYLMTVFREIPFSCIQFPLYEYLKKRVSHSRGRPAESWEAAICGSFAGGVAAALTTPLDVLKTRIMLAKVRSTNHGIVSTFKQILKEDGPKKLFAGLGPRVTWISIGGFIFLGAYEKALRTLEFKI